MIARMTSGWKTGLRTSAGVVALSTMVGCGGAVSMDPRFVALHNAMAVSGLVQAGEISQGSLPEGAEAVVRVSLQAGACSTFVALGTEGVSDLDLHVRALDGRDLVGDRTQDAAAAVRFCAPFRGEFDVVIRMARGNGGWLATSWAGGGRAGGDDLGPVGGERPVRPSHGGAGTCEQPFELALGSTARGDTSDGDAALVGSCVSGDAPEHVYAFTLEQRSQVQIVLNSTFDGALYLQGACGQSRSELGCNDDAPTTSRSELNASLEVGTYFVVVDGFGGAAGTYDLAVSASPLQSVAELCAGATLLQSGQPVAGSTTGAPDSFQATCAGQARSGDRVYAIDVAQRSRLRVRMQSTFDGALHVRRECADPSSELLCNDDFRDTQHSLVTATVDPGRYFVFADGYATGAVGDYSITADLGAANGVGGPGDTCATATAFVPGQDVSVDTFSAADDLAGSCGGQGSPDVVYRIELRSRTRLRATFASAEFAPVVYLQRATCGAGSIEEFCVDANGTAAGPIDRTLAPGTYFLVVDGESASSFGQAQLSLQLDDLGALETSCRQAPTLRPGRQVTGDTTASTDRFQATCGGSTQSPDLVYRLQLRRTQRVRISSEQTDFDGAIYVRRDCTDGNTEVACNDDAGDNRHSMIETVLEAGSYFFFVDGFGTGQQGHFTLDVDVSNP